MMMKTNPAVIVLASLLIAACASAPKEASAPSPPEAATSSAATETAATAPLTASEVSSADLAGQLHEMQKNSVYFDFGEFVVKPEYREVILRQAGFMKAHGNVVVTLEGNTDERGSSEYNLALGEKRADAVRKSLEMMGVPSGQIKTASFGEERPRLACHEEQCWKENRRVDFIGKPGS
jgi:peptidoglycan-associated lipoprotein